MSASKRNRKIDLHEDEWAFVDMQGTVVPKEEVKTSKSKSNKRKHRTRPSKQEADPDFEVIKDDKLTMSTIIATTEVLPFQKDTSDSVGDWGIVMNSSASQTSHPGPVFTVSPCQVAPVEPKPDDSSLKDIEFIQIPETQHGELTTVESPSDTSSTCSFDVIDETKGKVLLSDCSEMEKGLIDDHGGDDDDDNDDSAGDIEMIGAEFHFDVPTVLALFCLTTVLGFVIGHGVGIATSLLVVKTPSLKVPPESTPPINEQAIPDKNNEQSQNFQLEGKIQKWKSLFRNEKRPEDEGTGVKASGNLPGLKEAHRQLSLENYKLKKAYSDIQRELDLMKVMSWYRRAQVDKLRQDDKLNMTFVVGMLKKELQYLEAVYFREKRLADMWRDEEKAKVESAPKMWKEFKERWNGKNEDSEENRVGVCIDNRDCGDALRAAEENTKETDETKGDYGTIEDTRPSNQQHLRGKRNVDKQENSVDQGNIRNQEDFPVENMFWRHLRLAKTEEDLDFAKKEDDQISFSSDEVYGDQDRLSKESSLNYEESSGDDKQDDKHDKDVNTTINKDSERTSSGLLTQQGLDWFSYEVLEEDEDIIFAYENKDNVSHVLYGFFHNEFREIESGPGNIFVISMKRRCIDVNSSFLVSLQNRSPKPIHFFALLPNGKIKHQKIAEQVRVSIVEIGSKEEKMNKAKPWIYEASVLENSKLEVNEQNDGADEPIKQTAEYQDEDSNDEFNDESSDGHKVLVENEQENPKESEEMQEGVDSTPQPNQEVPPSSLDPGESHIFNPCTGKLYRHTVSAHQYAFSEYENLLAQNHTKQEQVYYRFPRYMILEKFIVKDEEVKTNTDGSILSIGEENKETVEDSVEHKEPVQYEEEVLIIVKELLSNPWKDGNKVDVMMTYDSSTGTVTSIYVTMFKVHPDDVMSHDVLKNGKIEKIDETIKITSYLLHGNEVIRIVREDEIKYGFTKIATTPKEKAEDDSGVKVPKNENSYNPEKKSDNYENLENEDNHSREKSAELFQHDGSEPSTHKGYSQESQSEECILSLGDSNTDEYWAFTIERGPIFIRVTTERVMETPKYQQEDFHKLKMLTNDVEESVSYNYCGDGSVQKTWQRIEKVSRTGEHGETVEVESSESYAKSEKSGIYDDEELDKNWSEDHDEEDDDEQYDDTNDDQYYDHEQDDIDEDNEEFDNDEHDSEDDSDDDAVYDNDDEHDDPYNDETNYEHDDPENEDDIHVENEDDFTADDIDYGDIDKVSEDDDGEEENDDINEDSKSNNDEKRKDWTKENYEMFISREWQNLKLRQQQFENSKKQNLRLQKQMLEEWEKMKVQHKQLQENFGKNKKSKRDLAIEGIWNDLKYQQNQFDNWKKQIEEELKESLKKEWEKLEKKQREVENREHELYKEDEPSMDIVGFYQITEDQKKEMIKQFYLKNKVEEQGLTSKVDDDVDEMVEVDKESNVEKLTFQSPELDNMNDWTIRVIQQNPDQDFKDNHVDRMLSKAWEMNDSNTQTQGMAMEDNLPHELPPHVDITNEEPNHHVDKLNGDGWTMSDSPNTAIEEHLPHELLYIVHAEDQTESGYYVDETSSEEWESGDTDEEELTTQVNLPQEKPYIPSTDASELDTFTKEDDTPPEKENEPSATTSDNGLSNFEVEDTRSSSQWEVQIQKLREELDRLYEAKHAQIKGKELQVVKREMESPIKPVEELKTTSEKKLQPKCPPKCPQAPTEANKINVSPPVPKESDNKSRKRLSPTRSNHKTKQHSSPTKSEKKTKQKAAMIEKKPQNHAFMDFIEGHGYLRQLEPEEYDDKMLNGPLAPGKKSAKRNKKKIKFEDGNSDDKTKELKKRKQEKYLKKKSKDGENGVNKKGKARKLKRNQYEEKWMR